MLFNSFEFVLLVAVSFAVYYAGFLKHFQVHTLITASLFFYGYSNPGLLALFLASVVINVSTSYLVVYGKPERQKLFATIGVIINLSILAFFKYGVLVGSLFFNSNSSAGSFLLNIPLPIGISFFTFEGISLLIDAFKDRKRAEFQNLVPRSFKTHILNTTFFVAFFPHLIAGPILKAHDFIPQIGTKYLKQINWESCYKNLVMGYFLKMVIADQISQHTFWIQYPYFEGHSSTVLIAMLFGYSMQIFADFAGYSLIAIGVAGLFGYRLMENFNFPYISTSFSEFWRRWHISLSTFLKEYLYIPLGGNHKGKARTYLNLIITMVLGGLWHGAASSYAIWGAFHGIALASERLLTSSSKKQQEKPNLVREIAGGFIVFSFVSLAWLLFKLTDITHVFKYFQAIVNNTKKETSSKIIVFILIYSVPVILYHAIYLGKKYAFINTALRVLAPVAYAIMLFMIITNSGIGGDFIYFQF
ncbi:MBOAT family O-acyltransferase [Dyadobacter luticola]|uniref:MBOAT family protein n=1 Tax=Dyadobacter luticola TaxID=1979387 RepID=A0A5R9KS97_9BACT|nr:MBOAT family O-acyltransferase [Dyadobacter luticola]TLU98956.1 MBOAT family protein [Dyadobacter luticola]